MTWFMLVAAAGTPPDIVEKLHREVRAIIGDPQVRTELTRLGLLPVQSPPPDELRRFIVAEIARWGDIVKKAGLVGIAIARRGCAGHALVWTRSFR